MSAATAFFSLLLAVFTAFPAAASDEFKLFIMPTAPFRPTDFGECGGYARKVSALVQSVNAAHDSCLASASAARSKGAPDVFSLRPLDTVEACTEARCQSLHNQRGSFQKTGNERVERCNASVQEHLSMESARNVQQRQNEAARESSVNIGVTGAAGVAIKGATTGAFRGAGTALGNPVLGAAAPFLDAENGRNIYKSTEALRRQGKGSSGNVNQARLLEEQERAEKEEAERLKRSK